MVLHLWRFTHQRIEGLRAEGQEGTKAGEGMALPVPGNASFPGESTKGLPWNNCHILPADPSRLAVLLLLEVALLRQRRRALPSGYTSTVISATPVPWQTLAIRRRWRFNHGIRVLRLAFKEGA